MDISKAKDYYYDLIGQGILTEIFPHMTGNWEDDRDLFEMEYIAMTE